MGLRMLCWARGVIHTDLLRCNIVSSIGKNACIASEFAAMQHF
jgi:hypothetical protein